MAIYLPLSKFRDSSEAVVAPGAVIQAEGMALVRNNAAQAAGVLPSTGGNTDLFSGFSMAGTSAAPFAENYFNKVEVLTVATNGSITLSLTPVSGQVSVLDTTTGTFYTGTITITGSTLTGNPGFTAGDTVQVTYKYAVTNVQSVALWGNTIPGGYSGAYIGQIGLLKRGMIYTTQFDASKNWAVATGVTLAANGQLTDQTGSGVVVPAQIIAVPSVTIPYLGLEFSAE
jgi:hypothetical protein